MGGKLSQPIIAAGKAFVASVHQQTLYALDEATGKVLWQYTADGRIDSPPTYHNGVLYFGTRSGRILALAAVDGRKVWQHRIAPTEQQIISYNQLESVWPVHGSTLVVDDVVYAAAGRNVYLDGGIYAVGLDAATGEVRHKAHFAAEPQAPETYKGHLTKQPGVIMNVMQSDGANLFLGNRVLDKALNEPKKSQCKRLQASEGFLTDLGWNRDVWKYTAGNLYATDRRPQLHIQSGQLLVHDQDLLYGIRYFLDFSGQSATHYAGHTGYRLSAALLGAQDSTYMNRKIKKKKEGTETRPSEAEPVPGVAWEMRIKLRVRAMVKAGDTLFVAGPPEGINKDDPLAPYEGRGEALLRSFNANDGNPKAEIALSAQPVFDGMIAANGKLFIAHTSGALSCWK